METKLTRIAEMAKRDPNLRFTFIGHLINEEALMESHWRMKPEKQPVSTRSRKRCMTKIVAKLVGKLKQKSYRPLPARRTYIPKDEKSMSPLGIPAYEDKLVQDALKRILEAIYEQDFLDISYGFRPNRSMHDALKKLTQTIEWGRVNYVVDADIKGFFNHVDHDWLMRFLDLRIGDPNIIRLVKRMLIAGIQEDGVWEPTEEGTPQGSVVSPVLANIYLHYVLDIWFEVAVKKRCKGQAEIVRFADDFVCCFQYGEDATLFYAALKTRLDKFNLSIAEEKTNIIEFGRFAERNRKRKGKGKPETFDFLGFTHYCSKSRKGTFRIKRKTSNKKFRQKVKAMKTWIKENRHLDQETFLKTIRAKLMGHYRYYGVTDNFAGMKSFYVRTIQLIYKWMNRRSQRRSFTGERFYEVLKEWNIPYPRIYVNIYDKAN